ncbi:MAG: polyprenyl synthetase family protein [Candidatus Levybacteria bacterium]|nr:polyprenyl synthetase family protein [Candidatus Levybacteria bacterium]
MYDLKQFKEIFDPILNNFVDKKTEGFQKNTNDVFIKDFVLYSKNLITGGGKRIRPYITYLTYKSFGGTNEKEIMNILLSLELFHNFCLIHDDVMDKGKTRHGQTTIHLYVLEKQKNDKRIGDLEHIANSQAILIGDVIYSWLTDLFFENKHLKNLEIAKKYFYKMIDEVIMGQIIDVDLVGRQNPSLLLIEEKTRLKTSRYSFVRPMQIGAVLANSNYGQDDFLDTLGTHLGIAFQMQDDLLDIIGTQNKIQKTPLLDISQHQHTFFTNFVLNNGTKDQILFFNEIFGKKVLGKENEIRKTFIESGAIDVGKRIIDQNFNEAKKLVENSFIEYKYKEKMLELIELMQQRQS